MFNLVKRNKMQLFCEVAIEGSNNWVHGIILHADEKKSLINIFVFVEHLRETFKENEKVDIRLLNNNLEFLFHGIITQNILSAFEHSMIIKIDDMKKFPNLRRFERFRYDCSVSFHQENSPAVMGILNDVSKEGILITTDTGCDKNKEISIDIYAFPGKSIHFLGKVVRESFIHGRYKYAIKIDSIDTENNTQLEEFFVFLSMNKNKLLEEWKTFRRIKYEASMILHKLRV